MGKIVTFEQAKRLEEFGYDGLSHHAYWNKGNKGYKLVHLHEDYWNRAVGGMIAVPTVSEALDWIREEKGIACGIHPYAIHNNDCDFVCWDYTYAAFDGEKDLFEEVRNYISLLYPSHLLAENSLLDAVLTYLEEKK